jgi:hypothetical protein
MVGQKKKKKDMHGGKKGAYVLPFVACFFSLSWKLQLKLIKILSIMSTLVIRLEK